jgi:pyruvate dehydrogenase E1 component alpha subunit
MAARSAGIATLREPDDVVPLQLLGADGTPLAPAPMPEQRVLEALRLMKLSRALDSFATKLQRLGRLGVYGPVHGQEASVVGSAFALDPGRDWIVPAYREQPAMLQQGLPLDRMLAQYMGRIDHGRIPDGVNLLPRNQAVAAQIPHAVGLAWGLKIRKVRGAVLVYLGDGAASEGDFHESANFAGVLGVPLIMLLQNNGYAISTPVAKQSAAVSLAARGRGYGFPGQVVDGNDLFAVYSATTAAVERALEGRGPTLIESLTYRIGFHNTTDDPRAYRDDSEVSEAAKRDPIARIEKYLTKTGAWDEERARQVDRSILEELEAAFATASQVRPPDPSEMFEHVYADPPLRVHRQKEEFDALRRDTSA